MVEVASKIVEQFVSIFIDPGSTHSYITPRVVDICAFKKVNHRKSWLVQLATGTKRKVSEVVEKCPLVIVARVLVLACTNEYLLRTMDC